jgi:glyoxylase-like metal-dependent hydrolase (beta-lactamase superfamily II)
MRVLLLALAFLIVVATGARAGEVDRLYVIDCGWAHIDDPTVWSDGNVANVPSTFSNNCYLLHHSTEGYVLWDTGITDRLTALPDGISIAALKQTWHRNSTLLSALAAIDVKPSDIHYVAISHWHPDHTGNIDEFPDATVVMQKADWDYALTLPQKPFGPSHKTLLLQGDKDLFGDGSLTLLATPGHTAGHESLLVHLPKTGYIVLSGDVAHFQANWDNRLVPGENADKAQSLASMEKIAKILREKHAQLWINHDKATSDTRRHAPQFYE